MIALRERKPSAEVAAPIYQAQVTDWNERYGVHKQNADRWRMACFAVTGLLAWSVTGNIWQGTQSKVVPYVVERDHLGDEVAIGLVNPDRDPDPKTVQAIISRWLYDVRVVSVDMQVQRHLIFEAYDYTDNNGPARGQLDQWYKDNTPWDRAKESIVIPNVLSVLPEDPGVWKVWHAVWREDTMSRAGVLENTATWEAHVTVVRRPPKTATDIRKNNDGTYVETFSWGPHNR
jgi:type IV secretion system protein TrbF